MATHRLQDTGFTTDAEMELIVGVFDACEDLESHHRPITPETLSRWLRARAFPHQPSPAEIERSLAQLQAWRAGAITRALITHRRQLAHFAADLRCRQRAIECDHVYLQALITHVERLLRQNDEERLAPLEHTASQDRNPSLQ